ncbi:MAG TPA: hypothetical protein DEQ20_00945 [Desulfobulbaceae bacterium]|nr:MAG: hypothetical protein A2520_06165 [Deltaproteobacteria bacterium RIFOXYD12_FULL_53_23]HCC53484.1 hypothetical protein [Desulfobulbaceae bacterium]
METSPHPPCGRPVFLSLAGYTSSPTKQTTLDKTPSMIWVAAISRQQIKQFVVSLACRELLPVSWATWIIGKMGLAHD